MNLIYFLVKTHINIHIKTMFQSYREIIKDATKLEVELIKKHNEQKETISLEIKDTLDNESKNIINGQVLKSYDPEEISKKISSLNIQHKNLISQQTNNLKQLQQETDQKMFDEMKYTPKLPITEIYKDIYNCNSNTTWVCRVWFYLVENKTLKMKPGDPFKTAWFDIHKNRQQPNAKSLIYESISQRTTTNEKELKMPNFSNKNTLTSQNVSFNIDHWGEGSAQKGWWLEWITQNRPI